MKFAGGLFGVLIVAAIAFAVFEPIQVLPRIRLAPGYALAGADGEVVTSEGARGEVTLYTFAPTDCGDRCDEMFRTMREVGARIDAEVDLAETDFQLVTIALDPIESSDTLAAAARASGADGDTWRWLGGDEASIRNIVGAGFGRYYETSADGDITFDPGYVLVDGLGVVRGDYRYQTLAEDADKLLRHVQILGEEIRYADGAAAVAYEAAHLFLCYP